MNKEKMMSYLEHTDLSKELKEAICNLIQANNDQLKKDMPKVISDFTRRELRGRGKNV